MSEHTFVIKGEDGKEIFVYCWIPDNNKSMKGIIQIAHGMAEHAERYREFAEFMNSEGFAVYANDHRGHGKTAGTLENVGYFADSSGWDLVVSDMFEITEYIRKQHKETPVFLFGHSMGSFLSRDYISREKCRVDGVILSGTAGDPGILGNIGIFIARSSCKSKGGKIPNKLLDNLSFGSFNKGFKPERTKFDWLSRDEQAVDKYIKDEFCGGVFSSGFFLDLFSGIKKINTKENIGKISPELPMLFISGEKDPVGKNSKGVQKVIRSFEKAGIKDITCKFYRNGRHEMLNEINKNEVYSDITNWIKTKIKK